MNDRYPGRATVRSLFIAGGASGIGEGIAEAFASHGASVAIADIDVDRAETVAVRLRDSGYNAVALRLDVVDPESWERALDVAEAMVGRLDVVCNSAGILGSQRPFCETPTDRIRATFEINTMAAIIGVRAAIPRLKEEGGRIGIVGSMGGFVAVPGLTDYCASKAALVGLTDSLASELEQMNIHLSLICPGRVDTRLSETTSVLLDETQPPPPLGGPPARKAIDIGRIICRGILEKRRFIFTHPERRPSFERLFERIMDEFDWLEGAMLKEETNDRSTV